MSSDGKVTIEDETNKKTKEDVPAASEPKDVAVASDDAWASRRWLDYPVPRAVHLYYLTQVRVAELRGNLRESLCKLQHMLKQFPDTKSKRMYRGVSAIIGTRGAFELSSVTRALRDENQEDDDDDDSDDENECEDEQHPPSSVALANARSAHPRAEHLLPGRVHPSGRRRQARTRNLPVLEGVGFVCFFLFLYEVVLMVSSARVQGRPCCTKWRREQPFAAHPRHTPASAVPRSTHNTRRIEPWFLSRAARVLVS
jgi:hypothetical protein